MEISGDFAFVGTLSIEFVQVFEKGGGAEQTLEDWVHIAYVVTGVG